MRTCSSKSIRLQAFLLPANERGMPATAALRIRPPCAMTRREKKTAIFSAREPPAGTALTSRCNCACLGSPLGSPCRAPAHAKGCGQYQTINDVGGSLAECRRAQTPSAGILVRCNLCVKPRRTRAGMPGVADPRWSVHEAADAAGNRRSPRDLKAI